MALGYPSMRAVHRIAKGAQRPWLPSVHFREKRPVRSCSSCALFFFNYSGWIPRKIRFQRGHSCQVGPRPPVSVKVIAASEY